MDLLGGIWECQSVSKARRQQDATDPRFKYFNDFVCTMNFFQREQSVPMIYILENTYRREKCTDAIKKA